MIYQMLARRPAVTQYLWPRRDGHRVSGTFDVHTFESGPDWIGPDTGLENAVNYLFTRLDPGSYHSANDSDSTQQLIPWWYEAFHDRFTNKWAVSVSIATQAAKWGLAPRQWREDAIRRAATEAARIADEIFLCTDLTKVASLGIDIPAVWLTQAQAHARMPGFVRHGTSDPLRRSDPWPRDAAEGDLFLTYYKAARKTGRYATATLPTPAPILEEDDEMYLIRAKDTGKVYATDGVVKNEVEGYTLEEIQKFTGKTPVTIGQYAADRIPDLPRVPTNLALRSDVANVSVHLAAVADKVGALDSAEVDTDAVVAGVLSGLTPERIAELIPDALADRVIDALGRRITIRPEEPQV